MEQIKIKSYEYMAQLLWFILALVFGIISIIVHNFSIPKWIFGGLFVISIMGALLTFVLSKTYDIYDSDGIKRVRKSKILFEVSWDEVESIFYWGLGGVVALSPFVLTVYIKKTAIKIFPKDLNNYDDNKIFTTRMNKKTYEMIKKLIPSDLKKGG